jgi:hypothetical protein
MLIASGLFLLVLGGWLLARAPGGVGRHRS